MDKLKIKSGEHIRALADIYARSIASGMERHGNSLDAMRFARMATKDFNELIGY